MGKLEKIIGERFDTLADSFPAHIDKEDARVKKIIETAGDVSGKKILEVGCGKGRVARVFKSLGADIYGIDISDKLLEEAKKIDSKRFIKADAYNMPFPDDSFDVIYLLEVIEHLPDIERMFQEASRVLSKKGKLIIVDRNILSLNNVRILVPNLIIKKIS